VENIAAYQHYLLTFVSQLCILYKI